MKNLKKVLALVLAFACAFTMFAGAANFTDAADINPDNADAVELLTTLNVIQGYPDGSFDPEGTVTRAEMAKMIYVIRNGGRANADAHVGNTTSFTDISGNWAEGYIKYLQNTGIVAGKSAYVFDPKSPVTTVEVMKMALALAGYDEENAGLTGVNWEKNTLTYASTIGLDDDVNSATRSACTRQDAAQILANVLEATAVRYSSVVENFVNDSKTGLSYGGDPITVGYKWMDLSIYVGRMVSSGELNIAGANDAGKDRFSIVVDTVNGVEVNRWNWENWHDAWNERERTLTVKDGQDHTDLVGEEVKLLAGEKMDDVYGVYATGTSNVVETTMDQVDYDVDGLKIDNVVYDCEHGRVNGNIVTAVYADNDAVATVNEVFSVNGEDIQKVADQVKMIDWDDDGDYETIIVKTVNVAKVTSVTSKSISLGPVGSRVDGRTLTNNRSLDFDDNTIAEDLAKNDYAVVTRDLYDDEWDVVKATPVEGTVNGKVDNERRVRVDGEWYTLANTGVGADLKNDTDLLTIDDSRSFFENGDEVTLYTVGGIVYYAESTRGNDANRAVAMVYGSYMNGSSWNNTPQADIILANGDKLTVDVDAINNEEPDGATHSVINNIVAGKLYYYTIDNDGDYSFFDVDEDNTGYSEVADNHNGVVNNKVQGITIADEAIVFAYIPDENDAEVYTGRTVKDADVADNWGHTGNGEYMADTENGFNYVRMFNVEIDSEDKLDTTTDYGYLTTDAVRTRIDGTWYMEYEFWNGEENVTALERTSNDRRPAMKKHAIFSYASAGTNDDGTVMIKDVKPQVAEYAAITGANSSSVQLLSMYDGMIAPDVTNSTTIFYVNSDEPQEDIGVTGAEGYDYVVGQIEDTGRYPINAAYVLNNDEDEVKLLVIDVDNQLDGKGTISPDLAGSITIEDDEATTSEALIAAIENAAGLGKIVIEGKRTIDADDTLNVPAGLEVIFEDELELKGTVNGDITVDTIKTGSDGTINGTLTITGDTADNSLDDLKGEEGAEIELSYEYGSTNNFYGGDPLSQINEVPVGTYSWSDENTLGVPGWEIAKVGGETTINGNANAAALEQAFAMYDDVIVTGDVTIDDTDDNKVTITADQTLTVRGNLTVDNGKTLTVNGALDVDKKLTVGGGTGAVLDGVGTVVANEVGASGTTGAKVDADLSVTVEAGDAPNLVNWAIIAESNTQIKLNSNITTTAANQFFYSTTVDVPSGDVAPAGTYVKNGNGWLLNSTVDSITLSNGSVNNALVQAAFAKTDEVILKGTHVLADAIDVTTDNTLVVKDNVSLSSGGVNVLGGGTLKVVNRAVNLTIIKGASNGTVIFENVTNNGKNYGSFYDENGSAIISNAQLKDATFVWTVNVDGNDNDGFKLQ